MSLLEARNVVSGYGDAEILHGVDLNVENDEIVTIIGPNGAGKSTMMKATYGLIDCWEGSVRFSGEDITSLRPNEVTRRGLCYVPQKENVFPTLSVRENLEMGAYIDGNPTEDDLQTVWDRFPILSERRNQRAGSMSGGQQQMLALSSALMIDPDLLLVDEPSAGLAPDLVDNMFDRLVDIRDETNTAILMVEQNARQALSVSDRGYVLDMGENEFEGDGTALLESDEVAALYLGE
ncbi:ABC transporter ATP-binding protein [Haloquadratum walsbyi]|jgi:ABC-type branched-chain amino acid transport systems, ATPase component|uniref:ABC-type branched-chain amino acid transport system, ATPase component n=1 Tax=Haloquadratum walsbyi J07HQW2 TaxID=1238425 RepID=U1PMQ2_9EURY|nr:ABC transporter ATP-binding protein [Haloquadratum walsbyi]ERG95017.1 MAG: ABC-type branched-chain amino acid transport system, ATPase component [Haloquadratum walsbyi J07HQW2]